MFNEVGYTSMWICSVCSRVHGDLSLGLILYLSEFPVGKAQLNCVRVRARILEFEQLEIRERSPGSSCHILSIVYIHLLRCTFFLFCGGKIY